MIFAGQITGFAAMIMSWLVFIQYKRKNILLSKLICDTLWTVHYILLLSYSAAAVTTIAIFREYVFYNYDKQWAKNKVWSPAFSLLFIASAVITWKNVFSLIPATSTVLTTIAFRNGNISVTRLLAFIASLGMLIYGINCHSIAVIINECVTESVIMFVTLKFALKNKE